MKTSYWIRKVIPFAFALLLAIAGGQRSDAQAGPKTLDAVQEIAPNGAVSLTMSMSFDAAPWRTWRAQVGDEPARLRAMMRHQFSAYDLQDFKLEKNDLERTATVSMRSPVGPELRKDGSFRLPVEKMFRLVNRSERDWFFSGNNPYAANTLNTVKLVLPSNTIEANLVNAGNFDQAVIFRLESPAGSSRTLVIAGSGVLVVGLVLAGAGFVSGSRSSAPAGSAAG